MFYKTHVLIGYLSIIKIKQLILSLRFYYFMAVNISRAARESLAVELKPTFSRLIVDN